MADTEVKVLVSAIPALLDKKLGKEIITKAVARIMGQDAIREMKDMISKGISPIRQAGRFDAYKATKESDPALRNKGYPFSVKREYPSKRQRPVNLHLSGKQLADLIFKVVPGKWGSAVEIGYFTPLSAAKESGHREGVNGQPKRPTIPNSKLGESFAIRIDKILTETVQSAVDKFIKGEKN
jgi:hypothetical protein